MIQVISVDRTMCDGMNVAERSLKRGFDFVVALLSLLLLSPLFLVISVMLYFRHDGPVFFCQERIGYEGRPFNMFKFRTLRVGFEDEGKPLLCARNGDTGEGFARFLRDHHLDELPQLLNVVTGDMSFVGPRPERKFYIDQIMEHNPDYEYIYRMRPGLTSMATIYNGYTDTMEKMLVRLQMDLEYYRKRSLWMDLKIILTTANYILNGKKI